jgi:hypothetical protein
MLNIFSDNKTKIMVSLGKTDGTIIYNYTNDFKNALAEPTAGGGSKTNTKHKKITKKHISKKVLSKRKQ